jgi:hypothetical protein
MVSLLYEVLLEHRTVFELAQTIRCSRRNGTRNRSDNVRIRIVAPVQARASEMLEAGRLAPIADLAPHMLRRTFASVLADLGVPPRRAMYLHHHADPKFTMRIYQRVLDWGEERRRWCAPQAPFRAAQGAFTVLTGRDLRRMIEGPREKVTGTHGTSPLAGTKKLRKCGALRAADGIRTHDLLHGKQSLPDCLRRQLPANGSFLLSLLTARVSEMSPMRRLEDRMRTGGADRPPLSLEGCACAASAERMRERVGSRRRLSLIVIPSGLRL